LLYSERGHFFRRTRIKGEFFYTIFTNHIKNVDSGKLPLKNKSIPKSKNVESWNSEFWCSIIPNYQKKSKLLAFDRNTFKGFEPLIIKT
jgi:hypothetical protein